MSEKGHSPAYRNKARPCCYGGYQGSLVGSAAVNADNLHAPGYSAQACQIKHARRFACSVEVFDIFVFDPVESNTVGSVGSSPVFGVAHDTTVVPVFGILIAVIVCVRR